MSAGCVHAIRTISPVMARRLSKACVRMAVRVSRLGRAPRGETVSYSQSDQHRPARRLTPDYAAAGAAPAGTVVHFVSINPATHFDFRYQSREGVPRIIHLQLASLVAHPEQVHQVEQFHASVHPRDKPRLCTFYTLPESIKMSAQAIILIRVEFQGIPLSDSHGSFAGLKVNVRILRNQENILTKDIQDTHEYNFRSREKLSIDKLGLQPILRCRYGCGDRPVDVCDPSRCAVVHTTAPMCT